MCRRPSGVGLYCTTLEYLKEIDDCRYSAAFVVFIVDDLEGRRVHCSNARMLVYVSDEI